MKSLRAKQKNYITNLYPGTKVIIDGPCEFIIKQINSFGQIEFAFVVNADTYIDTFKIKKEHPSENNKTKKEI